MVKVRAEGKGTEFKSGDNDRVEKREGTMKEE